MIDQLLLPYKFYGSDVKEIYFFIFASCDPVNPIVQSNKYKCYYFHTSFGLKEKEETNSYKMKKKHLHGSYCPFFVFCLFVTRNKHC